VTVKARIIEYFTTSTGKQPAREWLNSLNDKVSQAIIYKRIRQAGLVILAKTEVSVTEFMNLKLIMDLVTEFITAFTKMK